MAVSAWLNQLLSGDFFGGLLAPYTAIFGVFFWGLLFIVLNMALYLRTRSLGYLAWFSIVFTVALVGGGVFPQELQPWVTGILVLTIAAPIFWVFARRERY